MSFGVRLGSNPSSASTLPLEFIHLLQAEFSHRYEMGIISQIMKIWGAGE